MPQSAVPRAILALGLTQIIGYGTLYYAFGALAGAMTPDIGISLPFAFGAFSLALLAGGLAAPVAGRTIGRFGARPVMAAGSVFAALALVALSQAQGPVSFVAAVIAVEMVSTFVLYDAAFAALAQVAGAAGARRAITLMTLIGGFASTLFWPLTVTLTAQVGWRETYLIFALLHLVACLPLHLSLPRAGRVAASAPTAPPTFAPLPPARHPQAMLWLGLGFALSGAVLSAFASQWVPVLQAYGLTTAAAVTAGAIMGPAQVGVRLIDLVFGVRHHPLSMAILSAGLLVLALVLLIMLPTGLPAAMAFALCYGLSSRLSSIVRGTVPLALFGAEGYATRLGTLAAVRLVSGAIAPFALALALSGLGAALALSMACTLALLGAIALSRVPH